MNAQVVTPEVRQWIVEQVQAGCRPEDVLAAMRTSGWQDDVAVAAMAHSLQQFLPATPVPPHATRLPEPALAFSPSRLWAGDAHIQVLLAMQSPRVVVFGGLLSDD